MIKPLLVLSLVAVVVSTAALTGVLIMPASAQDLAPPKPKIVIDCGSLQGSGIGYFILGETTYFTRITCGQSV